MNGQLASIAGRPAEGGEGGSSDDIAAFLHEVAGVGEHQRRRRPANDPAQPVHRRHAEHRVPGTDHERTQRGFFARLRIEPFGPESGILPHERTLSGPKEDRYRLLRATSLNTSPILVSRTVNGIASRSTRVSSGIVAGSYSNAA